MLSRYSTPCKKMMMQIKDGWLIGEQIRHVNSPNRDPRPYSAETVFDQLSLIVIHNISLPPGEFGACHIDELFTNCLDPMAHPFFADIAHVKVSAHIFIDRAGNITQYVPFNERAWHAGKSSFQGRENCNDFSIGIELEGTDNDPYTEAQYLQLAKVTEQIMLMAPRIKRETIVGHCDIAPDRKTDPGESFDWMRYRQMINQGKKS